MTTLSSSDVRGALVVLTDGSSATLDRAVESARPFGEVVVLDRSLVGRGEAVGAQAVGLDWKNDPAVEDWMRGRGLDWIAVVGADEEILAVDPTAVRRCAEEGPVGTVATDLGDQIRIVGPGRSVSAVGADAPARADVVVRRQLDGPADVTIIVPTFGRPTLLPRAVMAALRQRDVTVEVVVVNDGGPEPWAALGPLVDAGAVRCVDASHNRGLGGARNVGLSVASGRHVLFLDDDDVIHDEHVATLRAAAGGRPVVRGGAVMVHVDPTGREVARMLRDTQTIDPRLLMVRNEIVVHTALIDRQSLSTAGGAREDLEVLEDWEMWIRLSQLGEIGTIDWFGAEYHLRAGGETNVITRSALAQYETIGRVYELHPTSDGEVLAARQRCLDEHRALAEQAGLPWPLVIGVLGDADPHRTAATVRSALAEPGAAGARVIVHQPHHPEIAEALSDVDAVLCVDRVGDREQQIQRLRSQALGAPLRLVDAAGVEPSLLAPASAR